MNADLIEKVERVEVTPEVLAEWASRGQRLVLHVRTHRIDASSDFVNGSFSRTATEIERAFWVIGSSVAPKAPGIAVRLASEKPDGLGGSNKEAI